MPKAVDQVRVLLVDDEESIIDFVKMGLEASGYAVSTAMNGLDAVSLAKELKPHLVILDIMLPGMNGYEVCSEISRSIRTSIIMLTARDDIDDRVRGLDLGADDYMVKPFSFRELLARVNARMRGSFPELLDVVRVGEFTVDDGAHEISLRGSPLPLSLTEYNLLRCLLLNSGLVMSKQLLLDKVWGFDFCGDDNIVEVYVRYVREKIGDHSHQVIRTVRGVGYKAVVI